MSDWEEITLGEACEIEIGGTPSRSEDSYWWKSVNDGQALPWVSISDMKERVVSETKESITEIGAKNSNCKRVTKGTLLMSFKLTIGRLAFAGKDLYTNEAIAAIRPREGINPEFLYYGLQYWNLTDGTDQAVKGVTLNKQKLQEIRCSIPPLPEQKKIAEILSGIDNLITQRTGRQGALYCLLKSLISEVDQYGKATDSGAFICESENIPHDWRLIAFKDLFIPVMDRFTLSDHERYSPVIVRRRNAGIETRETKLGTNILVKEQFFARQNCFLISKRQAIHGSTGIVPKNLGKNPIISKEYLQLTPVSDETLDIRFMDFYSRSSLFHEGIRMSVYGVDIEKYVFKEEAWFSKKMLVPPLAVQRLLANSFSSIQEEMSGNSSKLSKLRDLKTAVSSDLLSGRKRVSV